MNFVSQMAEWLRRQIRTIMDLSDGVSPRRFKSCSGSGLFIRVSSIFCPRKCKIEVGPDIIMFRRFLLRDTSTMSPGYYNKTLIDECDSKLFSRPRTRPFIKRLISKRNHMKHEERSTTLKYL